MKTNENENESKEKLKKMAIQILNNNDSKENKDLKDKKGLLTGIVLILDEYGHIEKELDKKFHIQLDLEI